MDSQHPATFLHLLDVSQPSGTFNAVSWSSDKEGCSLHILCRLSGQLSVRFTAHRHNNEGYRAETTAIDLVANQIRRADFGRYPNPTTSVDISSAEDAPLSSPPLSAIAYLPLSALNDRQRRWPTITTQALKRNIETTEAKILKVEPHVATRTTTMPRFDDPKRGSMIENGTCS